MCGYTVVAEDESTCCTVYRLQKMSLFSYPGYGRRCRQLPFCAAVIGVIGLLCVYYFVTCSL